VDIDNLNWQHATWQEILPQTKLQADKQHHYDKEVVDIGKITHVRLNIYPDGGVARLRVHCQRAFAE
jgi:allantoicase